MSTAYSNCNLTIVEEKIYPLPEPADVLIQQILDANSDQTPTIGDPFLMGRPNSYTISKAIAECLIAEKYSDLPVAICRPSIVAHAFSEPDKGWCDSFNGLAGNLSVTGLGIVQTLDGKFDNKFFYQFN